jgi:threonine synthase
MHGAEIVQIEGSFDDALRIVREISERHTVALVNSVNPHRIAGQKTAAFEIVDELGDAPDLLCIPVGNAGNITAYWGGFEEYHRLERTSGKPRMWGFQAEGAAPLVLGHPVEHPETIATAIRIGNPASWEGAINARDSSGGSISAVSDDEILEAYRRLGRDEGIFCEPASAASLAGLMKQHRAGVDLADQVAVCVLTGHGLKDPDTAMTIEVTRHSAPAEAEAVERVLGWA